MRAIFQLLLATAMQFSPDTTFASGFEDAQVGLIDVRSFSSTWSGTQLNGNGGITQSYPVGCRTSPYVAGPNETAIFSTTASASHPSISDLLYVRAAVSINGAALQLVSSPGFGFDALNLSGSANMQVRVALAPGASYVFATAVASNVTLTVAAATCTGTVQVIRTVT